MWIKANFALLVLWLRRMVWSQRLRLARQYRAGFEDYVIMERAKAAQDVIECERMVRALDAHRIVIRADSTLRRRTA